MQVAARVAIEDDLDVVDALATTAIDELTPLRGGAVWSRTDARVAPVRESLAADLAASDTILLVGTIDDTVVGYAAAHVAALHDGQAMARVTDLYVMPDARKVGVGEALILELESWGRDRELIGLDALALPGDRDTKNFFESFGLVARAILVHRPIES